MAIDYKKYPPNWLTHIRPRILKRANNKCEGSPKYPMCRAVNSEPHPKTHSNVVLTIAHLDHDPSNWEVKDDRLKAMCQRCHLGYDMARHVANRKYGRDHLKNQNKLDL